MTHPPCHACGSTNCGRSPTGSWCNDCGWSYPGYRCAKCGRDEVAKFHLRLPQRTLCRAPDDSKHLG